MKECPHCSGPLIDEAVKCRHCGGWLKSYPEMLEDESSESAPDYLPVLIGIPLLLILHFMSGYFQTPDILIKIGLSEGIRSFYLKLGYAIGITLLYAFPLPIFFAAMSLLFKKLRTVSSFTQIIFWVMIITLIFNLTAGFIFTPEAFKDINHQDIPNK